MIFLDYKIIRNQIKSLCSEKQELDDELQYYERCLKEADVYAKTFSVNQSEDFKVFSPRSDEILHRDEINKINSEKELYEKKIIEVTKKINRLSERISQLEEILNHEDYNLSVLNVLEQDRQRIARDLHDTSLQNLAHLVHRIELSSLYIDTDATKAKLELSVISKLLKDTIGEIRNTIFDLRPMTFDDLGIKAALENFLVEINQNHKFDIRADIDTISCNDNLILVPIFRVVQESINNICKHANAKTIIFNFKQIDNKIIIDVIDDGIGFSNNSEKDLSKHFGLTLMRERVELLCGSFLLNSKPGEGTSIHIEIPIIK